VGNKIIAPEFENASKAGEVGEVRCRKRLGGLLKYYYREMTRFMDAFIMVHPTDRPMNEKVGAWATEEMDHAIDHWRRQFRGEARVKSDTDLTDAEMAANNLIIWGDPQSAVPRNLHDH
jgi:hypothetical protein